MRLSGSQAKLRYIANCSIQLSILEELFKLSMGGGIHVHLLCTVHTARFACKLNLS